MHTRAPGSWMQFYNDELYNLYSIEYQDGQIEEDEREWTFITREKNEKFIEWFKRKMWK